MTGGAAVATPTRFSPATQRWFDGAFPEATPAQTQGWEAIARGDNTLICAPTGSGKTLAAFLWFIDRLITTPATQPGVRLLYLSPLKALNYDVERNLRGPLAGIRALARARGDELPEIRVGVRTGDTAPDERRRMQRTPPEILITTPESLYLLLTSSAREMLGSVEAVIIDEIHAVAQSKRGAHLALSLERLSAICERDPQRVALSATQRPLEEVARFAGGDRPVTIVDAGTRKQLELRVELPVEDLADLQVPVPYGEVAGAHDSSSRSIWPAIYPELLALVRAHRSTLIFVNSRRLAERLALRLNELAEQPLARAHHGSVSREARGEIEEALKAGTLPCLVATSSLELGIDMGAIDLVVQVESPGSVAAGIQRIGRAGHQVGVPSRGRIFPKYRGDLVECAVVAQRMQDGEVELTRVPQNPLDVLCQQLVAICSMGEHSVDELHALVRRAYPYRELSRVQLEGALDLLSGRYPSDEFAELRPRLIWDRVSGGVRAREGAQRLAIANAGTIPDRGLYGVFLVDGGGRVGELDEEMVHEAREGQVFLLGASSWRIEEITRDRVLVSPAPGQPGQIPFWKGEQIGRPVELGLAVGRAVRELAALDDASAIARLTERHACSQPAALNLLAYLREQELATGVLPSDRAVVLERFRDEVGDWRLCILSPHGARVHHPWGLALRALLRERHGLETHALSSDDGIILHLPDADGVRIEDLVAIDPEALENLVVGELSGSPLFGGRFRENAARALLIPRRRPGQRTPLWQQRLRAQSLLQVAERYGSFPIILETYRELLQDHFDLPALRALLSGIRSGELSLVAVESQTASPFAQALNFAYVGQFLYEDDTPAAERRAQALTLDRDLLRELLGQDELRELLDASAIAQVEAELQAERGTGPDALCDLLRRVGDLGEEEAGTRMDGDPSALAELAVASGRALRVRIAGEPRLIAVEDAGRYRDALGVMPPSGVPAVFLETVEEAFRGLVARYARRHGPFTTRQLAERYGVDEHVCERTLATLDLAHGGMLPHGSGREWCNADVLRRIRRASLAVLRREVEAVEPEALQRLAPSWHGIGRGGAGGLERLREVLFTLQRVPLTPEVWERDVLPARVPQFRPAMLDELCTSGELTWIGCEASRVAIYFREDAALLGHIEQRADAPSGEAAGAVRAALAAAPRYLHELRELAAIDESELTTLLWRLVWAGEATNDGWAPLRRRKAAQPRPVSTTRFAQRRLARRRAAPSGAAVGRWSTTSGTFEPAPPAAERQRALAELLLERHGVVARPLVASEGLPGGYSAVYGVLRDLEVVGTCRRGYFVEGLGGAQFALAGAIERLRDLREPDDRPDPIVLAASDPANLYGTALRWPDRAAGRASRAAGALVVLAGGTPLAYVERGGRSLLSLADLDQAGWASVASALAQTVHGGRLPVLALERIDGEPAVAAPAAAALLAAGFAAGPRKLTLRSRA